MFPLGYLQANYILIFSECTVFFISTKVWWISSHLFTKFLWKLKWTIPFWLWSLQSMDINFFFCWTLPGFTVLTFILSRPYDTKSPFNLVYHFALNTIPYLPLGFDGTFDWHCQDQNIFLTYLFLNYKVADLLT